MLSPREIFLLSLEPEAFSPPFFPLSATLGSPEGWPLNCPLLSVLIVFSDSSQSFVPLPLLCYAGKMSWSAIHLSFFPGLPSFPTYLFF